MENGKGGSKKTIWKVVPRKHTNVAHQRAAALVESAEHVVEALTQARHCAQSVQDVLQVAPPSQCWHRDAMQENDQHLSVCLLNQCFQSVNNLQAACSTR